MNTILKRFENRENAELYTSALSNGCDQVIGACHIFAEVAKKWNGKRYNKRFTEEVNNALHERFGSIVSEGVTFYNVSIHKVGYAPYSSGYEAQFAISLRNRSVQINGVWLYFDAEIYNTITVELSEGNRIDAETFEKAARKVAQVVLQTQTRYTEAVRFWDKNVAILTEIDEFIKERIADVNCLFVDSTCRYFTTHKSPRLDAKL
jgi:hypothetical protein